MEIQEQINNHSRQLENGFPREDPYTFSDEYRPTDDEFFAEISKNPDNEVAKLFAEVETSFAHRLPAEILNNPELMANFKSLKRDQVEIALKHAEKDHLTGLDNKAGFQKKAKVKIEEAIRLKQPVIYVRSDKDGFKDVNDQLGHEPGDDLLREFAEKYKRIIRTGDLISRIGGDEFDGLFVGPELIALIMAKKINALVPTLSPTLPAEGDSENVKKLPVSASIGISIMTDEEKSHWQQLREEGTSPDEILRALAQRADNGLQWAKADGKDCSRLILAEGQSIPVLNELRQNRSQLFDRFEIYPSEKGKAPIRKGRD
jgi:diguanylate cyclase (GGDEF)-like protein